jgi:hypothetical protein
MEQKLANSLLDRDFFFRFCFQVFPLKEGLLDIFYGVSLGLLQCDGDSEEKASALFNVL